MYYSSFPSCFAQGNSDHLQTSRTGRMLLILVQLWMAAGQPEHEVPSRRLMKLQDVRPALRPAGDQEPLHPKEGGAVESSTLNAGHVLREKPATADKDVWPAYQVKGMRLVSFEFVLVLQCSSQSWSWELRF